MDLIGWCLFAIGALLLVLFAFIGIDVNGISITNLAGTLVGSTMMISGAVFVAGSRIETTLRSIDWDRRKQTTVSNARPSSPTQSRQSGHIKNFKGYELTQGEGGVYVNGNKFSNVLEAEQWVREQFRS